MTDDYGKGTRQNRFSKKRKNTKALTILYILGVVLLVLLVAMIFFGGNDEATPDDQTMNNEEGNVNEEENQVIFERDLSEDAEKDNEASNEEGIRVEETEEEESQSSENNEETDTNGAETYEVEATDENVKRAYEGNWQPVGTEQEGPHTTNYDNGSIDRQEMSRAVEAATGIPVKEQTTWWAGRAGDQAVEITVSPKSNEGEIYRVHLAWVDQQGWQPTLVEELIEKDIE
ncbi:YrrS family protein [Gracilibacillus xinjiangensis]|uniref:YrrS family protein n=1 Tax=Gracilibacillus xinjiangensis TaxID=1193282 RepID=A0ABV8WYB8_9BACI